jgi:hypothetical protein
MFVKPSVHRPASWRARTAGISCVVGRGRCSAPVAASWPARAVMAGPVRFAVDLAGFLTALWSIDPADGPRPESTTGFAAARCARTTGRLRMRWNWAATSMSAWREPGCRAGRTPWRAVLLRPLGCCRRGWWVMSWLWRSRVLPRDPERFAGRMPCATVRRARLHRLRPATAGPAPARLRCAGHERAGRP